MHIGVFNLQTFKFTHWLKQIFLQGFTNISNSRCRSKFQEKNPWQQGGERQREGEQPSGWREPPKSWKAAFWQICLRSSLPNHPDRSENPFQAILFVLLWLWVISIYLILQWGLQWPCRRGCRRAAWSTFFSTNQVAEPTQFPCCHLATYLSSLLPQTRFFYLVFHQYQFQPFF